MQRHHPSLFRRDLGLYRETQTWTATGIDRIASATAKSLPSYRAANVATESPFRTASRPAVTPSTSRGTRIHIQATSPMDEPAMHMADQGTSTPDSGLSDT